jgi:hypothetical protein
MMVFVTLLAYLVRTIAYACGKDGLAIVHEWADSGDDELCLLCESIELVLLELARLDRCYSRQSHSVRSHSHVLKSWNSYQVAFSPVRVWPAHPQLLAVSSRSAQQSPISDPRAGAS